MDDETRKALSDLLTYVWADEHTDYMDQDDEGREGHIFKAIMRLDSWLEFTDSSTAHERSEH